MQSTRLGQAFIEVTIARDKDDGAKDMVDFHQPEQERPIEAGSPSPVKTVPVVTKNMPVVQQSTSYQNVPPVPSTSLDQGSVDGRYLVSISS